MQTEKMMFTTACLSSQETLSLRRLTGITAEDLPALRIYQFDSNLNRISKWRIPGAFSQRTINTLFQKFIQREAKYNFLPYEKEDESDVEYPNGVVRITKDNFEEAIFRAGVSFALLVVAPTDVCFSCEAIAKKFIANAAKYEKGTVNFGIANSYLNELDDIVSGSHPELFLFGKRHETSSFVATSAVQIDSEIIKYPALIAD
jgi:hypothetical protein